jgi:hypothetical protein
VGFIPLLFLLTADFACHDPATAYLFPGVSLLAGGAGCYTGAHLAQTLVFAFTAAGFLALCGLFTVMALDSHPLSTAISARSHARADSILLVAKTLLVLLVQVFPFSVGRAGLMAVIVIAAVVWLATHLFMLPFTQHRVNRAVAAMAAVNLWVALCLVLEHTVDGFDAGIMVYGGAPFAALTAVLAADARANHVFRTPVTRLDSSYAVELKVRVAEARGGRWWGGGVRLPA